jgi:hypothetical protein
VVAEVVVDKMEIWEEHQAIKVIQEELEEMVVDLDHGWGLEVVEWDQLELHQEVLQLDLEAPD